MICSGVLVATLSMLTNRYGERGPAWYDVVMNESFATAAELDSSAVKADAALATQLSGMTYAYGAASDDQRRFFQPDATFELATHAACRPVRVVSGARREKLHETRHMFAATLDC